MPGPRAITLNCRNCGAKLDVYEDMDRFTCSYCGAGMLVERRGGTVMLKAVTDAIQKVQSGTDKTAAELALVRLKEELVSAQNRLTALKPHPPAATLSSAVTTAVIMLLLGFGIFWIGLETIGIIAMVAGGLGSFARLGNRERDAAKHAEWKQNKVALGAEVGRIQGEIHRNRQVASGQPDGIGRGGC